MASVVLLPGAFCASPVDTKFVCPEEFGYYEHPEECSLYYVCVFGGPLLESCTGGLVYSNDLQTCDWPRNVACIQPSILDIQQTAIAIEAQKDQEFQEDLFEEPNLLEQVYEDEVFQEQLFQDQVNSREPRKQDPDDQRTAGSNFVPKENHKINQEVEEELSLSPQPSIVNTVTHGAQKRPGKQDTRAVESENKKQEIQELKSGGESEVRRRIQPLFIPQQHTPSTTETAEQFTIRTVKPQTALNFGDVLFGSRGSKKLSTSDSGPVVHQEHNSTQIEEIEQNLLASYPGVPTGVDDSQYYDIHDISNSESFYYSSWDDPIYDQFEDYVDVEVADDDGESSSKSRVDTTSGNIFLDMSQLPSRPESQNKWSPRVGDSSTRCNPRQCLLPDCHCGGPAIPGNLSSSKMPQLVILTFDDSVNDLNKRLYKDIFHPGRKNPNGCPIAATFYVSHEWTDYGLVQSLYADGHEIASHSISHSFGEQFSKKKWIKEMAGQREVLAAYAGVAMEDVRGIRAPFLAIGGNNMFSMLHEANFTYDSSMPIYENKPPSFPYTMDYRISHECMIPPCPNKAFPGVWEVPLVMWNDLKDGRCSMADACSNPPTAEGVYYMILKNFQRHYNTNKSPFGLFYHPAWFTHPHHKEGFELFLDTIIGMDDVWLVSSWQAVQWMRNPTPLEEINNFEPFKCNYKNRPPRCDKPIVCNLWHKSGVRYMRTCQTCPDKYPWTGRTGVANSLVDNL